LALPSPRRFLRQLDLHRLISAGQRRQFAETDKPELFYTDGLVLVKTVLPEPATVPQNERNNAAPEYLFRLLFS
jgi:predicted Ser/Thr protein kinase